MDDDFDRVFDRYLNEPISILPSDPDEVLELSRWMRQAGLALRHRYHAARDGWHNIPHPDVVANAEQLLLANWHRAGSEQVTPGERIERSFRR